MNTRQDKPNATDGLLQALQAIIENVDSGQVEMYWNGSGADRAANLNAARAAVALALEERRSTWRKPVKRLPHRAGNLVKTKLILPDTVFASALRTPGSRSRISMSTCCALMKGLQSSFTLRLSLISP